MHPNESYIDLNGKYFQVNNFVIYWKLNFINSITDYLEEIRSMVYEKRSNTEIKNIMEKFFDRKCWQCDTEFDNLKMAKLHYSSAHRNPNGFLSCCNLKLRTNVAVLDHIQWHINPHTFSV